jgi:OOP family OmpA-OmpF porin
MKIVRFVAIPGLAALAATVSPAALADDSGWYAGFNVGEAHAKLDDARIRGGLLRDGFNTTSLSNEDKHFGFKLFGGYDFSRRFAVEAGYFDLGRYGFMANTTPAGTLRGDIKVKGLNADLVGSLPVGERFSLFARAGLIYAEAKDAFVGTGAVAVINPAPSKRAANYKYGVGARYDISHSVGLRAEAERYRIDDAVGNKGDIDLYSVGLVYRFGAAEPPRAPAPREVEPPPVVAPVVAAPPPPPPPPPPPVRRKVNFSADSLFDFDKDVIKPAGLASLDAFAADLRGAQFENITVVGHTDRIGSHAYNLKLSSRRADAVKAYLVTSAGIPADKVTARGADGDEPVTRPDDCKGQKRTPQLIACLQPDRRVEVEVAGSRLEAAPAK